MKSKEIKDLDTNGDGVKDGLEFKLGRNPKSPGLIRDLFIPHEGNDYNPKILQPKRLAFHAVSIVVIKVVVVGFLLAFPLEAWLTPVILEEQETKIAQLTNDIRNSNKLGLLKENLLLRQAAYNKNQDMLVEQYFSHLSPQNKGLSFWLGALPYHYQIAGENLAMSFPNPEKVVEAWTKSPTHYANIIHPDFEEMGISVVAGNFKNQETTMITQFFGTQQQPKVLGVLAQTPIAQAKEAAVPTSGEITTSNLDNAKLYVNKPVGQDIIVIQAVAYLNEDIIKANVSFQDYQIDLYRSLDEQNEWSGSIIIPSAKEEELFDTIVLANLTTVDEGGNSDIQDINWDNIVPAKNTALYQYLFYKKNPSTFIQPLFDLSSIYFTFILIIAVISLFLNIFIQIRKQHPNTIIYTLGLIILLMVLTVY